jgi:histone deacetylase 1/2
MEMHGNGGQQSSANLAAKGGRGNQSRGGGRGNWGGFTHGGKGGHGSGGRSNFLSGVFCQLCSKEGHTVVRCFKRFDQNFTGPSQKTMSSATTNSYGVNNNWYMDSGATDHVTGELEKLTIRDKYHGNDQVHTTSGVGMRINHVGHTTLHSPISKIHLNNVLHVPHANKSLVSVNRLTRDNNAYVEFHPNHFFCQGTGNEEDAPQRPM